MLKLFLLVCFSVSVLVGSLPLDDSVIEGHIEGGKDTDITEVPHLIAMFYNGYLLCGGFIVSPKYIVTSAQCVELYDEPQKLTIRAGSSSMKKGGVVATIKNYTIHPKYDGNIDEYDVAVVELVTPLKLNDKTIKAIKLATKEPSVGSPAVLSGWGAIDEDDEPVEMLQSATFPIYDRSKCATFFKQYNITINDRMTCAGGNGKYADMGDNGSPLVFKNEVLGVVSFRFGFGDNRRPIVFTNLVHPEIAKFVKDVAKL